MCMCSREDWSSLEETDWLTAITLCDLTALIPADTPVRACRTPSATAGVGAQWRYTPDDLSLPLSFNESRSGVLRRDLAPGFFD